MKLSTAIVSSDNNPLYIDFFPLVHRVWRDLVGVRCVLALIAESVPEKLAEFEQDIILFQPISGISTGLHAQCIRLVAPQLINTEDAVVLSDIDMLPMNRAYFHDAVSQASKSAFVIYRDGAIDPSFREVAICYNAASPETWRELLCIRASTISEAQAAVRQMVNKVRYSGIHGGEGWSTDQLLLFRLVDQFDPRRLVRLNDPETNFVRLDRVDLPNGPGILHLMLAAGGYYADYHMLRPYQRYMKENDLIVDAVLSTVVLPGSLLNIFGNRFVLRYYQADRRRLPSIFR